MTDIERTQLFAEALGLHSYHAAAPNAREDVDRVMAVADAEQAELQAQVERLKEALAGTVRARNYAMGQRDAERRGKEGNITSLNRVVGRLEEVELALADERATRARVEAVRQRVLDPTAHVTEGPLIARIKVDSWLRAALDGND